jgi:PAS domain S-box-containing protein
MMQHNFDPEREPITLASLATEAPSIEEANTVMAQHAKESSSAIQGKALSHWSHPLWGYLSAIIGQILAVSVIIEIAHTFSTFHFPEAFVLLVTLLVALGWGVGPSLAATFVGAALLLFLLLFPSFSQTIAHVENVVGVLFYIGIGLIITLLTNQIQQARYKAWVLTQHMMSDSPSYNAEHTEYALQLREERLRVALKNSSITVYQQDSDLRYTWIHNPLPTFTPEMILGKTDVDFMLPNESEYLIGLKRRVLSTGEGIQEEIQTTSEAGANTIRLTIEPLRDPNNSIVGVTGTAIDITAQKQAEEERVALLQRAQQSEYRFQRLFGSNLIGLIVADHEQIYEANNVFLQMFGYTQTDLQARQLRWQDMTPPDPEYTSLAQQALNDLSTIGECQPFEKEYFHKDGHCVPILIGAVTIQEKPLRWISFVLDLSERKRLEQEGKARARQLEALFEAMTDGVMVYDRSGYIIQMNTAAREQLSRYIPPEGLILSVYERARLVEPKNAQGDHLEPSKIPAIRILTGEIIPGSNAQDVRAQTFDGEDLWLNMSGTPLRDDEGQITGAITIARDVTERRQQELHTHKALEALMEMAQVVVQGTQQEAQGPFETTPLRQTMQRLAQLTLEVLGCQRLGFTHVEPGTELLGPLAVAGLPPEQEQQWWREQEGQHVHLTDGGDLALIERLRANEILLLDMSQPPYNELPNPYNIKQMLTAPMILGTQLLGLLTLDYRGLDHTYTPEELALTRSVTKLAALAIERDRLLTEAAQARANELVAQEAGRLKDEFIGIASHELRTPMTTMKANLQLAQRQLRRFMQEHEHDINQSLGLLPQFLERTERQLERQQRLVRDLLDASRVETGHLELHMAPCDLITLLREAVEDQQQATPNRTIQLDLPELDTIIVMADRDRVNQVISNYLSNALKYSEADKPVVASLQIIDKEARIAVRDEGPGLSHEQQQRIWERFYRVPDIHVKSGSGIGLGLGLHISRTIIEQQGGKIGVESEQTKGSTFWFAFPLLTPRDDGSTPT